MEKTQTNTQLFLKDVCSLRSFIFIHLAADSEACLFHWKLSVSDSSRTAEIHRCVAFVKSVNLYRDLGYFVKNLLGKILSQM